MPDLELALYLAGVPVTIAAVFCIFHAGFPDTDFTIPIVIFAIFGAWPLSWLLMFVAVVVWSRTEQRKGHAY